MNGLQHNETISEIHDEIWGPFQLWTSEARTRTQNCSGRRSVFSCEEQPRLGLSASMMLKRRQWSIGGDKGLLCWHWWFLLSCSVWLFSVFAGFRLPFLFWTQADDPIREITRSNHGWGFQYDVEAPSVINRRGEGTPMVALVVQTILLCVTVFRFCWFSFLNVFVSSAAILIISSSDPIASK